MALTIKAGSTDQTVYLFIQDSSSSTGAGLTGLVYNTASLTAYYCLGRGAATAITLATLAAATSAHADGGFKEVDATNMPGIYRLDLPDAAVASGIEVIVFLKGAANMVPVAKEIALVAYDPQSATNLGLSKFTDIETDTQDIQTRLPAALVSGRIDASVGAMAANTITAAAAAADFGTEVGTAVWATTTRVLTAGTNIVLAKGTGITGFNDIAASAVWAVGTRVLTAGTNIVLAKGVGITGFNDLDAAGVRGAVGLASANLDTQLSTMDGKLDTIVSGASVIITNLGTIEGKVDIIDANVDTILTDVGNVPTASENADALLDRANGIETGYTPRQSMRLILSATAAKLSGAATTNVLIRDVNDTKNRIDATVDADGNRTAVTLDAS